MLDILNQILKCRSGKYRKNSDSIHRPAIMAMVHSLAGDFRRVGCWDIVWLSLWRTRNKMKSAGSGFPSTSGRHPNPRKPMECFCVTLRESRYAKVFVSWDLSLSKWLKWGSCDVLCDHQDVPNHPLAAYDFMGRRSTLHGNLLCCLGKVSKAFGPFVSVFINSTAWFLSSEREVFLAKRGPLGPVAISGQAIFSKLMALEPISKIFGPSQIHGLPTRHFFWGCMALWTPDPRHPRPQGVGRETTDSHVDMIFIIWIYKPKKKNTPIGVHYRVYTYNA